MQKGLQPIPGELSSRGLNSPELKNLETRAEPLILWNLSSHYSNSYGKLIPNIHFNLS